MKHSEIKPGDRFGNLTVQSIQQHYRDGKKSGKEAICLCDCGNQKVVILSYLITGHVISCGCLKKLSALRNIQYANDYLSSHPEIRQENGHKTGSRNIQYANDYLSSHPEIRQENGHKTGSTNVKYALGFQRRDPDSESSLQKEYRLFLEQNNISYESEVLLEDHYFDFRISNFLIEIHGDIYHSSKYENLSNPSSNGPSTQYLSPAYHKSLLDLATSHGFRLIQLWEHSITSFNKQLLLSQLNNTININNYIEYVNDQKVICNDYGFNTQGTYLPDSGRWISTTSHEVVLPSYEKGKVLVFNSGYTVIS